MLLGPELPDIDWQLAELYYFDLKKPRKAIAELEGFLGNLTSQEKRENRQRIGTRAPERGFRRNRWLKSSLSPPQELYGAGREAAGCVPATHSEVAYPPA